MRSLGRAPVLILVLWLVATLFWWGLAFFPTPATSPEWLVLARNVCFGTLPNGLPGPDGWMMLILGPLSFLAVFVIGWPGELSGAFKSALADTGGRALLLTIAALVAVESYWVSRKIGEAREISSFALAGGGVEKFPEHYPRTNKPAPEFALVDQSGSEIRLSSLKGETLILTFAFAHCQTVCPVLVQRTLEATGDLGERPARILIVTLDPWRDTPSSLPFLAKKWNLPAHAHVLSGKVDDVLAVLKDYSVPYQRDEKTGEVAHPALTYVLSGSGEIAYTFNNAPVDWITDAVRRIENGKDIATARQAL